MTKNLTLLALAGLLCSGAVLADEARPASTAIEAVARQVLADYQEAVVWITATIRSGSKSNPVQVTGVVVDESGLVLCSLRALNPSYYAVDNGGNDESEVEGIKVNLTDGREIPAELVIKDGDLDIAILRLKPEAETGALKLKAVDLKKNAEAAVLDRMIELDRLNAMGNRQPWLRIGSIAGITTKPRKFYFTDGQNVSAPVFTADGKILGISVMRVMKDSQLGKLVGGRIVLPASAANRVVEQVKNAAAKPADESKEKK